MAGPVIVGGPKVAAPSVTPPPVFKGLVVSDVIVGSMLRCTVAELTAVGDGAEPEKL